MCALIAGHYNFSRNAHTKTNQKNKSKKQIKKTYNKQLIHLKCSVFTGKSQTLALPY